MALPAILQQLGAINPQLGQIKNLASILRNAGNPQALLQSMLAQNPQVNQAVNYIKQNGGDPKTAFEKLASERGFDPKEIESLFK